MTGPTTPPALLDEVLPRYEAREVHEIFVAAPRADVYRALEALTVGELPLFRVLMGIRTLPARLARSLAFDRPGFAKLALSFRLEDVAGGTRVVTETRVDTTDPLAHRRFGAYWQVIRLGSSSIRRSWLRAIKRRAERAPAPTAAPTR